MSQVAVAEYKAGQPYGAPGQKFLCSDGTGYIVARDGSWRRVTKRESKRERRKARHAGR